MRRVVLLLTALALLGVPGVSFYRGAAPAEAAGGFLVGAAVVDDTWHVGAGAGQYGDDGGMPLAGEYDPNVHSVKKVPSYGVQSRLTARAIVIQGVNGERVALIKTDNYLAQDMLTRRVAKILESQRSTITYDRILYSATHDHSSPYYSTAAAGVWLFQDAVDLRELEYQARAMAKAIRTAELRMVPAKMGATTVPFNVYKGNIVGPQRGDDGTPAGYPDKEGDDGLVVMRFEDAAGKSIATWMNFGQHPESLDSYNLISADYVGTLERFIDRETGAPLVFSQGDVGSAEGPYYRSGYETLPDGTVRAWAHVGFAQMERGARLVADAVHDGLAQLKAGGGQVPMSANVPVGVFSRWTAGPVSHPYPSVSNCRTEPTVAGDPGAPVLGVPDCERAPDEVSGTTSGKLQAIADMLKEHGLPVPDNYGATSAGTVEENLRIRLQAVRIGEVLLASCSCEAQVDLIKNLESRIDNVQGNIYDGFDWAAAGPLSTGCTQNANTTWTCPDPPSRGARTLTITDAKYRRMQAQVHNDARGWDSTENALTANSEPADPAKIFGNFTKEELPAWQGYTLPVGLGHTGDYVGYTVSYREYQNRDSYRKALTSYGPHTADYMVTRLARMAGELKGGPRLANEALTKAGKADEERQVALALALGKASSHAYDTYEAALADDAGAAAVITPAKSITRFDGTSLTWRGGNNAIDMPSVRVDRRLADGSWAPYADQTGEVPVQVALPTDVSGLANARTGSQEWIWTAAFEAYASFPSRLGTTPAGDYRFVVDGHIRKGSANQPYHLESTFSVRPWDKLVVRDLRADGGELSFTVDPVAYPRTYTSPFRYIRNDGDPVLCKTCTFRPWAKTATVASATVTVIAADGSTREVPATFSGGRWRAAATLAPGERAVVQPGGVRDGNGEINGAASNTVSA